MKTPAQVFETLARFPSQYKIFNNALALLRADERVKGIYLSGSFSKGAPDIYSDLDVYILVPAAQREQIVQEHSTKLGQVGKLITHFPATHLNDPNMLIAFYQGDSGLPIHVDYNYLAVENLTPRTNDKEITILLDAQGILKEHRSASQKITTQTTPTDEKLQYLEDRFWGWIWYTYSKINRGELWEARDAIEYMRANVILPLLYFKQDLPSEGYRRVESKFSLEHNQLLEDSIPVSHAQVAYLAALKSLVENYQVLLDQVLAQSGIKLLRMADRNFIRQALSTHI